MGYRRFKNKKTDTSLPVGVPNYSKINTLINKRITEREFEYHETEALEVDTVILNEVGNRGSVKGKFLNSGKSSGIVKPLKFNKTAVPVVGEQVNVVEYNGQQYYTDIINLTGKVSENSIPGASGTYDRNTKFGKEFKSRKVKPIEIGEGCVTYEGRFGQTIHLDGHKNKPTIKISTHIDESNGAFRKENIDTDNSSIYITSDGLRGQMFNGQEVKNNSVLIRSDDILINGRKKIVLEADEVFIHARSGQTIKMGDPRAIFIPTIDAKVMAEFMKDLMSFLNKTMSAIGKATNPATLVSAAKDIGQAVGKDLPRIIDTALNEKYLNKQVMVADPNISIPKLPKIPNPKDLKKQALSKVPDTASLLERLKK
tara:strand:+ start:87 stop:1196 length:1110 start_codon:yes stop_codon:yes gene_type:complete